jgi:hypothetical protein
LNWRDVLPPQLAMQQEAWERFRQAIRAYAVPGATLASVGKQLGVSATQVRHRLYRGLRAKRSPIEIDLDRSFACSPVDALILLKGMQNLRFTTEEEVSAKEIDDERRAKKAAARERRKAREAAEHARWQQEWQEQIDKHAELMRQRRADKQALLEEVKRANAAHNRQPTALARDALKGKHMNGKAE